jgi:hypothetical protein
MSDNYPEEYPKLYDGNWPVTAPGANVIKLFTAVSYDFS